MIVVGFVINITVLIVVTAILVIKRKLVMSNKVFKVLLVIVGFILGVLFSAVCMMIVQPPHTTIYEARSSFKLANGAQLPEGTRFIKFRERPDEYDTIALYVNISDHDLQQYFKKTEDSRRGLILPYWLEDHYRK